MEILGLDGECFYSNEYTLSNMTTEAYVRDPRFEEIMWGIKDGAATYWLLPDRAAHFFKHEVDWANTAVVAHHAHFDGLWLAHHHGVQPAMWIDTLSMARVIDGPKAGNSLHDLCIRHGIGAKGDYVTFAKGKHLADFTNAELQEYGRYCCNDIDKTMALANIFLPQLPEDELRLIDLTVRMFTEPVFVGDAPKLRAAVATERARKIELLNAIGLICPRCGGSGQDPAIDMLAGVVVCKKCDGMGVDKKPLNSNNQFADLLRKCGVEPQTKTSPTTGEQIYAFAKTDSHMQELAEDEYEDVRALAAARTGVKSNIIETRAERYASSAERGSMPVYLSYGAAHTLRWGGGDSMNWQNLSNENANRPEMSVIKGSVMAPPGHSVIRVDSSQGEARVLAWLAGQQDLVDAFAQGRDVYSEHASTIYGRHVDRRNVKADYIPGQVGKIGILSFGFGSGWYTASLGFLKGVLNAPAIQFTMADMESMQIDPNKFLNSPKKITRVQAMPSRLGFNDLVIHCIVTEALVNRYRAKYDRICDFKTGYWALMEGVINAMIRGEEMWFGAHGIMRTGHECIHLPNGMKLNYRGIERSQETGAATQSGDATYWDGRKRTKIYGSLLTENTVQCLHRILVAGQMLEINDVFAGMKPALLPGQFMQVGMMTHDDIAAVAPTDVAPMVLEIMLATMKKIPAWAAGLPLTGEGGIGQSLLEAK